jgi:hypothetical protein
MYKKRHDIFAKIIHMNLVVRFNLLKDTQPHYIYKPESCLENDNYKLYFYRTVVNDIHIQHNRPDLIVISVIVYVLRQNCRAAGWRRDSLLSLNFWRPHFMEARLLFDQCS